MTTKPHHYFRAGRVERGARYTWTEAYSRALPNGSMTYPWMPYREAQVQARSEGGRAVFHETEEAAREALRKAEGGEA